MPSVSDFTATIEIVEGERLFNLLVELADLTTQQETITKRLSEVSREIRGLVEVKEA